MSSTVEVDEKQLVEGILDRVASDLAMIIDRDLLIEGVAVERQDARPAGEGSIHISFKLCFDTPEGESHGCLLMPLADAVSVAAYLMMAPDEEVAEHRGIEDLDRSMKDAVLEVGNFVAGAADAVLHNWYPEGYSVRSAGCQGVRADVRPAFPYEEGTELIVGKCTSQVHEYDSFDLLLLLPVLAGCVASG